MSPSTTEYFKTSRTYRFELVINGLYYTDELTNLSIISSINLPYKTFILTFFVDPNDIIENKLFGKSPIKLTTNLLGFDEQTSETMTYNLAHIKSSFTLPSKIQMSAGKQVDKTLITIVCVERNEYKKAFTTVNKIFNYKTPKEMIEELAEDVSIDNIEYDEEGENKIKISQHLVLPQTFFSAIKEMHNLYGLYDGPYTVDFGDNGDTLSIKNLNKRFTGSGIDVNELMITFLAQDKNNDKLLEELSDTSYFSFTPFKNSSDAAKKLLAGADKHSYITYPSNDFFSKITKNIPDIVKKYGLVDGNGNLEYDDTLIKDRTTYNINHTGYEDNETFINTKLIDMVSNSATIDLQIFGELPLEDLLNTGNPVKFKTQTLEYQDIAGKYMLHTTTLSFSKSNTLEWQSKCNIKLVRTFQLKGKKSNLI